MAVDDDVVVVCMLDDKIKVKQAIHLVGRCMVGSTFWGIFIGMFGLFLSIYFRIFRKIIRYIIFL
jgi:uncharacterized membrane protein